MARLALLIVIAVLTLVLIGAVIWSYGVRIDPLKVVRDAATGYQSGHPRHTVASEARVRWDPIGDLNLAAEAFPMDDRAYPLLAEIAGRLRAMQGQWQENARPSALPGFIDAEPWDDDWDTLVDWLERGEVLELSNLIMRASDRAVLGQPLTDRWDPIWIDAMNRHGENWTPDPSPEPTHPILNLVSLPALGPIRHAREILDARARLAAWRGDAAGFCEVLEAIVRLSDLGREPGFTICRIVGIGNITAVVGRVNVTLRTSPGLIDDATAVRIDDLAARVLGSGLLTPDPYWELMAYEDILRRLVDDDGVFVPSRARATVAALDIFSSDLSLSPSTAPLSAMNPDLVASYHWLEAFVEAGVDATRVPWRPFAITPDEITSWENRPDSIPGRIGRELLVDNHSDWASTACTFRTARQRLLGLRVALAAHRHQLRHGIPPESLGGIDADLLTFEPIDGFTGGRLVYRRTDSGYLVYALGADGDDDGGRPASDPSGEPVESISDEYLEGKWDGDWVLFPPRE